MEPATLNLIIKRGVTFGPLEITCADVDGNAIALAGWKAFAQGRKSPDEPVVLDFSPVIAADDSEGLVTIPAISYGETAAIAEDTFFWDLILEDNAGRRLDPILGGTVTVTTPMTQP